MAPAGVVAHTSSWTPAAYELDESSPLSRVLTSLGSARDHVSELPDGEGQGDKVVYILMGLTAGNAAGYRGGVINTGIEDILVLPAVTVVSYIPGPALRDGFSHVLGLRIVVPEALRRLSGQLLRQRQSNLSRRCGVSCASCCGSGSLRLQRRCGVLYAVCCGTSVSARPAADHAALDTDVEAKMAVARSQVRPRSSGPAPDEQASPPSWRPRGPVPEAGSTQ